MHNTTKLYTQQGPNFCGFSSLFVKPLLYVNSYSTPNVISNTYAVCVYYNTSQHAILLYIPTVYILTFCLLKLFQWFS